MASKAGNAVTTGAMMLVGGGVIGAGVALLLAPQAGRDTCRDIARYARRFGRRTHEAVEDFADGIAEFTDTVGDKAAEILNTAEDLTPGAKKRLLTAIEKGQEKLERQKAKVERMIA